MKIFRTYTPNTRKSQKTKDYNIFMIYNVFYFKCGINVNDNFRRTCKKTTKSVFKKIYV